MKISTIALAALIAVPGVSNSAWIDIMTHSDTGTTISIGDGKKVRIGDTVIFWERMKQGVNEYIDWDTALIQVAANCITHENATLRTVTYANGIEKSRNDAPSGLTIAEIGTPAFASIDAACGGGNTVIAGDGIKLEPEDINDYPQSESSKQEKQVKIY